MTVDQLKRKATGSLFSRFMNGVKERLLGATNFHSQASMPSKDGKTPLVDRFTEILSPMYFDAQTKVFFLNEGGTTPVAGIGRVYELNPAVFVDDTLSQSLERILSLDFPKDTVIAVSLFATPDVRHLLGDYIASRSQNNLNDTAAHILSRMAVARAQMFDDQARLKTATHTPVRDFRAWITVTSQVGESAVLDFLRDREVLKGGIKDFLTATDALSATLMQFGLLKCVWNEGNLTRTSREILNPVMTLDGSRAADVAINHTSHFDCVRDAFVFADTTIDVEKNRLKFGNATTGETVEAVTLSVTGYPSHFDINHMREAIGSSTGDGALLENPFLLTTVIEPTDLAQDKAKVAVKHARMRQLAHTEIGQFLTDIGDRSQDLEIAMKSCQDGKGLARVTQTLLIWAKEEDATAVAQSAKNVLSRVGFDAHVDTGLQMMGLMLSLPLEAGAGLMKDVKIARRSVTLTKAAAAQMLPVVADGKGSPARVNERRKTPQLLMVTRRGQLIGVDIFANRNGNFNAVVAGTSGSGKSVLAQELVMSMLATGGRVWVFDIGKSYQKCVELADGQFMDFGMGASGLVGIQAEDAQEQKKTADICLNPLDMLEDPSEMLDELAQIVMVMANGDAPMELTEAELLKQAVDRVVKTAKAHGQTPTMTDLTMDLMGQNDAGLRDLAIRLMPYAAGGRYAKYFEGKANVNFKSALVVLEMEGLSNKPTLQNAVVLILIMRILQEIRTTDRSDKKLIVIDEAWRLLSGNAGRFIEWACRTLRKYGAGIVCISQSMEDFQTSRAAKAVRMNADTVFLLRQKPQGIAAYTSDAGLQRTLQGLTTKTEAYSEVYVKVGDAAGVVARLILDPFSMTAYSTRADVFEAVKALKESGFSTVEAIDAVAFGKARGHA